MEAVPDQDTSICTHCDRAVPVANIDLHYAHCSRKLEKCKICGDMVPRKNVEDHYLNTHAPVSCSLCNETMERDILDIHKGENCPQRIVTCEFCEFPLPAIDLAEHQYVGIEQNFVTFVTNMLDFVKDSAMKPGAMALSKILLWALQAVPFQASTYTTGLVTSCSRHKSSLGSSFNMLSCKEYWSLKWYQQLYDQVVVIFFLATPFIIKLNFRSRCSGHYSSIKSQWNLA
ncbi:U2-associated protein [Vigna unguiculata]|uniref:U2-associated protein n=1 Tax=Vigna unguiculata TaxID=3917 RepID=A0A4D6MJG2_VIGUN|nr:U2-associated protein [Vigna unguiculata]